MNKAFLIAIEGIDGSGSTTQAKKLVHYFNHINIKSLFTSEPSMYDSGLLIRKILKKNNNTIHYLQKQQLALLYAADRLNHYALYIHNNLKNGIHVICDRYLMSSLAYQGNELNINWIKTLNKYAPLPHYTFLIDVHENIAKLRRKKRNKNIELFDYIYLQKNIRKKYLYLAKSLHNINIINGNGNKNDIFKKILYNININI